MNIANYLVSFGLLIIAMSAHEFSHGWVAYKLGDSTAKYSGRLTLNPLAHIDLMGTIILPLFLLIITRGQFVFGAAKPIPINYWLLKNPKRDMIWIGLSGPFANFIFALILSVLLKLLPLPHIMGFLFENLIVINVVLGVFNLIPIPPLDGSRVLMGLLPEHLASRYAMVERYGFFIIILLASLGILNYFLWPLVNMILGWLMPTL